MFLQGLGFEEILFCFDDVGCVYEISCIFEGIIFNMECCLCESDSQWVCEEFEKYQNNCFCGVCSGYCLKFEVLVVKIVGSYIGQVIEFFICEVFVWVEVVFEYLMKQKNEIVVVILKEICEWLGFLVNVGLDYLMFLCVVGMLLGGESQCICLVSQIGFGLMGVLYVLDEFSIGLYQCDNDWLLDMLKGLCD